MGTQKLACSDKFDQYQVEIFKILSKMTLHLKPTVGDLGMIPGTPVTIQF